jgi:hypothetical protein
MFRYFTSFPEIAFDLFIRRKNIRMLNKIKGIIKEYLEKKLPGSKLF